MQMVNRAIHTVRGFLSHTMGPLPNMAMTWLAKEPSSSPYIRRKMVPATTTEVRAGTNMELLKTVLHFISLELSMVARSMGTGIIRHRVTIV